MVYIPTSLDGFMAERIAALEDTQININQTLQMAGLLWKGSISIKLILTCGKLWVCHWLAWLTSHDEPWPSCRSLTHISKLRKMYSVLLLLFFFFETCPLVSRTKGKAAFQYSQTCFLITIVCLFHIIHRFTFQLGQELRRWLWWHPWIILRKSLWAQSSAARAAPLPRPLVSIPGLFQYFRLLD